MSVGYVERAPSEVLRPFLVCGWTRDAIAADSDASDRILPDGCVDIVWDGCSAFVAGPDTGPVLIEPRGEPRSYAGVRFRPGAAPALLRLPACAVRDQRVPLEAIWGAAETRRLADRLASASSMSDARDELERALVGRLDGVIDPLVAGAVDAIAMNPSLRVSGLADRLGVTDRTLHRRVQSGVGYGPKVLQRVARFRRFLAFVSRRDESGRAAQTGLAALARAAGYADQAHLTRECQTLAGLTPRQLALGSGVRLVQDGLTQPLPHCDVTTEQGARS